MKTLRLVVAAALAFGSAAFATNARVESMGKTSTFIMDDISIFDNPANMNLYPNFLIGELGHYTGPKAASVTEGRNVDPFDPWFGGIFSLSISSDISLSIGGVLNRKDERLFKYFPEMIDQRPNAADRQVFSNNSGSPGDWVFTPEPATNFDGFLGANINNFAVGAHVYWAHQDGMDSRNGVIDQAAFASALQADLGVNIEISSDYSFELSGGAARIQYGPTRQDFFSSDLFSFFGRTRVFSKIDAINGHLIPVASISNMNASGREEFEVNGGIGVDAAFERGFFWMGANGFYNEQKVSSKWYIGGPKEKPDGSYTYGGGYKVFVDDGDPWGDGDQTRLWQVGGTISFGIERNIWWDWFVIRVGGQKTIAYADYSAGTGLSILCPSAVKQGTPCNENGNYFVTEPADQDGSKNDNVGFGFGVNIEEKLKIDAVVAEDLLFRNPFQGGSRFLSRISATYSF